MPTATLMCLGYIRGLLSVVNWLASGIIVVETDPVLDRKADKDSSVKDRTADGSYRSLFHT